jgi:hypothetical protein
MLSTSKEDQQNCLPSKKFLEKVQLWRGTAVVDPALQKNVFEGREKIITCPKK